MEEILLFIGKTYGGNIAVIVCLMLLAWLARGKFEEITNAHRTLQIGQDAMAKDIQEIKAERKELVSKNDIAHGEFYSRIGKSEVEIARIKVKIGMNGAPS